MSAHSPSTRKQCDFTKLMMAGYELELNNGSTQDFYVTFHGPQQTAYEGGVWKIHVSLPDDYPFVSPSIGFVNKVLHPNVDESSGSVCLDVINQTWTPLYSLVNIFEVFLPQLLTYPNPSDPLNSEAASLLMSDKSLYEKRINEYVKLYASRENWELDRRKKLLASNNNNCGESSSTSILSNSLLLPTTTQQQPYNNSSSTTATNNKPSNTTTVVSASDSSSSSSKQTSGQVVSTAVLTPVSDLSDVEDERHGMHLRDYENIDIDDL
eukprot:GHVS01052151.1.p1 GENE.GHVS01052151.1~~GHVS01052151.1.p1  ORF type:complete len:267 (-),score=71.30 GHVS01052151.1:91-891(-)